MEEARQALEGVSNSDLEHILDNSGIKEVLDFLAQARTDSTAVGDACLNTDEIHKLVDGRYLVVVWLYANEWSNRPTYTVKNTLEEAMDYYKDNYTERAKEWGRASIEEWRKSEGLTDEEATTLDPLNEWEDVVSLCIEG